MPDFNTNIFKDLIGQGVVLGTSAATKALEDSSHMAGGILIVTSAEAAEAIKSWIKTITFFFGNHESTASFLAGVLDSPYASPIADLLKTPELNGLLQRASNSPLPFVDMLEKMPDSLLSLVKNKIGDDPLLGNFLKPQGPVGSILGMPPKPVDVAVDKLKTTKTKSLLEVVGSIEPSATIGLKELQEDGLVKDIKDVEVQLTNKWVHIKNFEEISSVLGEATDYAKKIVDSLTNLTESFSNTVQDLINHAAVSDTPGDTTLTAEAYNSATGTLNKLKEVVPKITFTLLLLPPFVGGVKTLRLQLGGMLKLDAPNAPQINDNAVIFATAIVFQAPFKELITTQYNMFAKQFNLPSV